LFYYVYADTDILAFSGALLLRVTLDDDLNMYLLKRPKIVKIKLIMPTSGCKKVVEIQVLVKKAVYVVF
jgi:hypothetical protein